MLFLLLAGLTIGPGGRIARQVLAGESLTDILAGRSPGDRGTTNLIKIKRPALHLAKSAPQQRVLPLLRSRAPMLPGEEPELAGAGFPGDAFDNIDFADIPDFETFLPPGDTFVGGPSTGGPGGFPVFPPGNPGLFPTDNVPPVVPPVVPPAVPEPATWLMMILGFGTIGGALRRWRKTVRAGDGMDSGICT